LTGIYWYVEDPPHIYICPTLSHPTPY
jgi:hypothetical protein